MAIIDHIPKGLRRHGFYYSNEIYYSDAYQELTISARDLLHCLLSELRFENNKKRRVSRKHTNNGSVSFTEVQFRKLFGYKSQTYLNARNQLITVGLVRQTYRGGMGRGDMAKYKVLCVEDILSSEQRWKNYPARNWASEVPKAKNNQIGINTRFAKGRSGRKLKATLKKQTHLDGTSPNGIEAYAISASN